MSRNLNKTANEFHCDGNSISFVDSLLFVRKTRKIFSKILKIRSISPSKDVITIRFERKNRSFSKMENDDEIMFQIQKTKKFKKMFETVRKLNFTKKKSSSGFIEIGSYPTETENET